MPGIYIHVPFCRQACHYCNFHFSTSVKLRKEWLDALLWEITLQKDFFTSPFPGKGGTLVDTLYFGGGTPSLLEAAELEVIFGRLKSYFPLASQAEVTLEANPDDITPGRLQAWKSLGVNRLSIGVQSFFDRDLRSMNRAHDAGQAAGSIRLAQQNGFENLSIDLIYGIPGLSDVEWKANVKKALEMDIPHLSCYALTVEPHTALDSMIRKQAYPQVDEEKSASQFGLLMDWLETAGYEHYEISNFALPGKHSRHNSSYWEGIPYLGLGPSAHSFRDSFRRWNVANNVLYVQNIRQGRVPFESETLTPSQQLNEYLMISLRTSGGCDLAYIGARFGEKQKEGLLVSSRKFLTAGKMTLGNNRLRLTRTGKLFADGIAAELFVQG